MLDCGTFSRDCSLLQQHGQEEPDEDEEKPKRRAKPKASLLEEAEDWETL